MRTNGYRKDEEPAAAPSRRLIVRWVVRPLVETAVLVALYFLLPIGGLRLPPVIILLVAPAALLIVAAWQARAIMRSAWPAARAVEALAVVAPLYLLLFAAAYWLMADAAPESFSTGPLSRVDALYFTVTIFSTVGFGDINAASQTARLLVTAQMVLNLLILGAGLRLLTFAVRRSRAAQEPDASDASRPE